MKTNTIHLSAALRALIPAAAGQFSGVLLDPGARAAIATDGAALAILPFPDGFTVERHRFIPTGPDPLDADASAGVSHSEHEPWGWEGIEETATALPPVYRIILDPQKLLALSAAMGAGEVTLEFRDAQTPITVTIPHDGGETPAPLEKQVRGYLMPAGGCGLIQSEIQNQQSSIVNPLPAPTITSSTERGTLEIHFGGRPEKTILEALKDPSLSFRYSGQRGTKRGVPPLTWYGPDNPFTRQKVSEILGTEIAA